MFVCLCLHQPELLIGADVRDNRVVRTQDLDCPGMAEFPCFHFYRQYSRLLFDRLEIYATDARLYLLSGSKRYGRLYCKRA